MAGPLCSLRCHEPLPVFLRRLATRACRGSTPPPLPRRRTPRPGPAPDAMATEAAGGALASQAQLRACAAPAVAAATSQTSDSASAAGALSRRSFAYSQPRFREWARTRDFNHLLLGGPLSKSEGRGTAGAETRLPFSASLHVSGVSGGIAHPAPSSGGKVTGKQKGNAAPEGAAARTPASPSFARQRGDLRLLGRETVNRSGCYLPGRVQTGSEGLFRLHVSEATNIQGPLRRGEHASGAPGCAIVRRPCRAWWRLGAAGAVKGRQRLNFLQGFPLVLPPSPSLLHIHKEAGPLASLLNPRGWWSPGEVEMISFGNKH